MTDSYAQEPAAEYGDQIPVENLLDFPYVRLGQKVIEALPIIGRDAFVTYCALLHYADRGGACWPTYASLMKITTFGRKKLMKNLKVLCDHKLLKRTQMRKGKEYGANRYTLLPLEDWQPAQPSEVPIWHHQDWSGPSMEVPTLDRSALDRQQGHHKLDPVVTRSRRELDPTGADENARAREADYPEMGNDGIVPDACAVFHAGFPCEHEQEALEILRTIMWTKAKTLKSHPSLHAFVHSVLAYPEDIEALARWWHVNRKPKDWSIPLMFSRPEETLATVQAERGASPSPSPGDKPDRPAAYRVFDHDEPVPASERIPAREVKGLIDGLMATFNENDA